MGIAARLRPGALPGAGERAGETGLLRRPRPARRPVPARGSNGFRLEFSDLDGRVSVSAGKSRANVVYFARHLEPNHGSLFVGKLPGFGAFAVRFEPNGKTEPEPDGCPNAPERRFGAFVGTIRFCGERGYTQVDAGRASGYLTESERRRCPNHPGSTSSTWTGDLAVDFPGLGSVALAGPGFYAGTCPGT